MAASLVYRHRLLYETAMLALYGRHYGARYRVIADLIPPGSTVVDLCCGPAVLFHRYLRKKGVQYTGLDLSGAFVSDLIARGGRGLVWNMQDPAALPEADYVVMQASLYHALPAPEPLVDRMLKAARKSVILAEPIRNLSQSKHRWIAELGRRLSDPGDGVSANRFTDQSLESLFVPYAAKVTARFLIPGGREKVFVLRGANLSAPGEASLVVSSANDSRSIAVHHGASGA